MTEKFVALRIRAEKAVERRAAARADEGQGALEYIGMILIAALIIGGVWTAIKAAGLDAKISDAINKILGG